MDDIVRQAIARWPDVPHCFGWLKLDARGVWRMRDEHAQRLALPGDRISHPALLGFINRNYLRDKTGQWYFQNGPQRVYVDLELTPYIARTDPTAGFLLHTGQQMPVPEAAWLAQDGRIVLQAAHIIAAVDDRDIDAVLSAVTCDGLPAQDALFMEWLDSAQTDRRPELILPVAHQHMRLRWIDIATLASHFGFVTAPRKPVPA